MLQSFQRHRSLLVPVYEVMSRHARLSVSAGKENSSKTSSGRDRTSIPSGSQIQRTSTSPEGGCSDCTLGAGGSLSRMCRSVCSPVVFGRSQGLEWNRILVLTAGPARPRPCKVCSDRQARLHRVARMYRNVVRATARQAALSASISTFHELFCFFRILRAGLRCSPTVDR